jgi:hypothetical protein
VAVDLCGIDGFVATDELRIILKTPWFLDTDLEMRRHALIRLARPPNRNGHRMKVDGMLDYVDRP